MAQMLAHIALVIHDYDEAIAFFTQKLGFDLVEDEPYLADMAMFSTDYPHSICLWPDTQDDIARATVNCAPEAKHKILAGNAVRVFNLN